MTESSALPGPQNETPEDVATLFSWANLHGAKYRDFSAARVQTREMARRRIQQALDEESNQARLPAETPQPGVKPRPAEPVSAPQSISQSRQLSAPNSPAEEAAVAVQSEQAARERFSAMPQSPWSQPDPKPSDFSLSNPREPVTHPAWLASEQFEAPARPPAQLAAPRAPEDNTLQGSRERLATRWFALNGFLDTPTAATPPEAAPAPQTSRPPVVAVFSFSLAGGVGKTSLVATLGRTLSARGERVLLVDTASFGLLPFFFGAQDQRPGQLRTFSPPSGGGDAPIQLIAVDFDAMGPENPATETLTAEIQKYARGVSRIVVDLETASGATIRRILKMNPLVIVPVVPDMNSVVSVGSIDSFFQRNTAAASVAHLPYYVLNQFDPSLPLHLDVREVLRERLGDRLLPFALRRASAVSEALAEGMTVMDYAPNSTVAEDFASLAGWVKSLSAAAASTGFRGVRWREQ